MGTLIHTKVQTQLCVFSLLIVRLRALSCLILYIHTSIPRRLTYPTPHPARARKAESRTTNPLTRTLMPTGAAPRWTLKKNPLRTRPGAKNPQAPPTRPGASALQRRSPFRARSERRHRVGLVVVPVEESVHENREFGLPLPKARRAGRAKRQRGGTGGARQTCRSRQHAAESSSRSISATSRLHLGCISRRHLSAASLGCISRRISRPDPRRSRCNRARAAGRHSVARKGPRSGRGRRDGCLSLGWASSAAAP